MQFLAQRGLLIPDPARQLDPDEQAIQQRIQALPGGIGEEVGRWVQVLRGQGRRTHPGRSFEIIRKYLDYLLPILQTWANHVASLREITADDVRDVLKGHTGNTARDLLTALRSLFRALKQERLVFRDPTRGLTLPAVRRLPTPIPTDRLGRPARPGRRPAGPARRRPDRHPWPRPPRAHPPAPGRPRPGPRAARRPP
jgi:hypothetical protein